MMRAGVVGASGGIGVWLTSHLLDLGYCVVPIDTRATPPDSASGLDLVVVSVPIGSTPEAVRAIAPTMRRGAVLAEIASLKSRSHASLLEAAGLGVTPLCVHPMFGPSTRSLRGRVVAVVPVADAEGERGLAARLFPGADIVTLDAQRHDRCMAAVLSLPYAVNLALARALGGEDLALISRMMGPTFALQYTLAQSVSRESPTLTKDLLSENGFLEPLLRAFTDSLDELVEASGDAGRFATLREEIAEALSRDPSYPEADERRQRAHRAIAGA